ncbi:MAG: hypothetical protein ACRD2J_11645 [Thermoanaerobaculia bacterium]
MKGASRSIFVLSLILAAATAGAAVSDDELWIPTAGRGPGAGESFWVTDLWIMAPGEDDVEVEITFLDRTADNIEAESVVVPVAGGETVMLHDVVLNLFRKEHAFGALHVEVADEDDGEAEAEDEGAEDFLDDAEEIIASAHIYDESDLGSVGLMLSGISSDAAISAESGAVIHLTGVSDSSSFRTNWFAVNLTEVDDEPAPASVLVEVLDASGDVIGSRSYAIPAAGVVLAPVAEIAGFVDRGALRFTMLSGTAVFGGSKVDNRTNDPSGLEATSSSRFAGGRAEFTDEFFIEDCTFSATGDNPFFPLQPGLRLELEGEDDGETVAVIVEVLNETFVVDGVTTRVVTETESADGEIEEISRNYFAECVETGSVFYFGEDVAIFEDGELVGSEGEWLAGENGARAGVIMPGTILVGSRYFQEIAPGVALDRAEHLATGVEFETGAGTFEDCLVVEDSNPLEPGARDRKVYCPGFGLVWDDGIELVGFENAPVP